MHADVLLVAALLERIVERAAQDGENVGGRDFLLLLEVVHHLRGRGDERGIDLVADDLGMVHQLARLRLGNDVVLVEKAAALEAVAVHALVAEFRDNVDVVPVFDHFIFLPQKRTGCRLGGRGSLVIQVCSGKRAGVRMMCIRAAYPCASLFSTTLLYGTERAVVNKGECIISMAAPHNENCGSISLS